MSWDTMFYQERIHIDHYIPVEAFDLTNNEEAKVCFNWKNLRPEWDNINNSKNDKMPDGRRARDTKDEYTLDQKKQLIENFYLDNFQKRCDITT